MDAPIDDLALTLMAWDAENARNCAACICQPPGTGIRGILEDLADTVDKLIAELRAARPDIVKD